MSSKLTELYTEEGLDALEKMAQERLEKIAVTGTSGSPKESPSTPMPSAIQGLADMCTKMPPKNDKDEKRGQFVNTGTSVHRMKFAADANFEKLAYARAEELMKVAVENLEGAEESEPFEDALNVRALEMIDDAGYDAEKVASILMKEAAKYPQMGVRIPAQGVTMASKGKYMPNKHKITATPNLGPNSSGKKSWAPKHPDYGTN